ncbi:protein phosphatase 1 regulatory subunit 12B-like [Homarus americanus]|uniref:Notch-regulated ankyrin repeat-containing protein-like n=1 Tax=Homarus americanus TaxID=6706 RepID=A0A8J5JCM2_HOMAM|nr:protein phosphatase 1 regulatory subunit 12B-like [Homarus americanus]KAG7155535.1 Notch-regulated ankyrin repeat-containing protein-like [Homarus americanus]
MTRLSPTLSCRQESRPLWHPHSHLLHPSPTPTMTSGSTRPPTRHTAPPTAPPAIAAVVAAGARGAPLPPTAVLPAPATSGLPRPTLGSSSADSGYPGVEQFGCQAEFVRAVQDGDPRELKRILTRYSQLVQINGFTADGQTALTQSCMDGNLEVIKVLVAHGASLHLTNRDGFSPLHLACWRGKYDVMQYLLRSASSTR